MAEFNPHNNKTANGVVITEGMLVRDYDYRVGIVIKDDTSPYLCEQGYCDGDHWFTVQPNDPAVGSKEFNGTRLLAL